MSAFVPCDPAGQSSWTQVTALDGVSFVLGFRWSQRDGHWLLDLADAEGSPIKVGMLLATGALLLGGLTDTRRPLGELAAIDTTGANDLDPGFSDLGSPGARFVLMYITGAEVRA